MENIKITEEHKKKRLDTFISELYPLHTRSNIKNLITKGEILVNGVAEKAGYMLHLDDVIQINFPNPVPTTIEAEDLPLNIVYQDNDLLVINKAQGMTVHPANTCHSGTLVNALLYQVKDLSGINGEMRPGIVHRLDKDTSGLMLVAKNDFSHNDLAKQISTKTCIREYVALLVGVVTKDEGEITTHIGRDTKDRKKMSVLPANRGRLAITHFWVEKRYQHFTLVRFRLGTGRTHQIRVHARHIGHPIVGDVLYNPNKNNFNLRGQLLHSRYIEFTQPRTKERLHFVAPLPDYFEDVIKKLD